MRLVPMFRAMANVSSLCSVANPPRSVSLGGLAGLAVPSPALQRGGLVRTASMSASQHASSAYPTEMFVALGHLKKTAAIINQKFTLDPGTSLLIQDVSDKIISGDLEADFFRTHIPPMSTVETAGSVMNRVIANVANNNPPGLSDAGGLPVSVDDVRLGMSNRNLFGAAMQLGTALALDQRLLPSLARFSKMLDFANQRLFELAMSPHYRNGPFGPREGNALAIDVDVATSTIESAAKMLGHLGEQVTESLVQLQQVPFTLSMAHTQRGFPSSTTLFGEQLSRSVGMRITFDEMCSDVPQSVTKMMLLSGRLAKMASSLAGIAAALQTLDPDLSWQTLVDLHEAGESPLMTNGVSRDACNDAIIKCTAVIAEDSALDYISLEPHIDITQYTPHIAQTILQSISYLAYAMDTLLNDTLKTMFKQLPST